jgi:hypothetical protein
MVSGALCLNIRSIRKKNIRRTFINIYTDFLIDLYLLQK